MDGAVCVLDASAYVGFWILKGLLGKGYTVHAAIHTNNGEKKIEKKIKEMEKENEKLVVYGVDVFDYQSIVIALKGCTALFCCFDSAHGYEDKMVDMEVRGVINVVEASAQSGSVEKIVFNSSLTAAIWKDNISTQVYVDETSWSNLDFCRKFKLWYALAKTESEKAAWGLAMDRKVKMVSINGGLVLGPNVTQHNPLSTLSYLKGAAEMYENGVLAFVDVNFLVDIHIRALEDPSACGRYFCFNHIVTTHQQALQLSHALTPLISFPSRYEYEGGEVYAERLMTKKLNKLVEGTAC